MAATSVTTSAMSIKSAGSLHNKDFSHCYSVSSVEMSNRSVYSTISGNSTASEWKNLSWSASDWVEGGSAFWKDQSSFQGTISLNDWNEGAGSCFAESFREPYQKTEATNLPETSSVVRSQFGRKIKVSKGKQSGSLSATKYTSAPLDNVKLPQKMDARISGPTHKFDFVVIGSGVAGLRYALAVAEKGRVAIVTKSEPQEGSTQYAQGGVSAVLDPRDSVENHIRDTIVAGAYLCDEEAVEVVCREGPDRVRELMAMGASFDTGDDGQLHLAREGGHSHHRIVHAADVTGREIERALLTAVQKNANIELFEHHFAVDLLVKKEGSDVTCYGLDALDLQSNKIVRFMAGSLLLASGGAGHIYPNTTNPMVATGDGVALAHRAGATISNMEFVQFHPTALADEGLPKKPNPPRQNAFLITEAVRGAGGILYNQAGERFMPLYDSRGELAPRDVVARSIDDQLKRRGEKFVWLDISHRGKDEIIHHFPNIAAECLRCGIDITKEPIPVVPAAHYMCGGIQTGLHGETSIKGLFAAGEVACTGLHGANRLASNSLLEALVFAQRAVEPAVKYSLENCEVNFSVNEEEEWDRAVTPDAEFESVAVMTAMYRKKLQDVMWDYVGIVRSTERLLIAERKIADVERLWHRGLAGRGLTPQSVTCHVCEMRNLLSVANLIVRSALQRHESRGLHFTVDFPQLVESQRNPTVLTFEPRLGGLIASMKLVAAKN